MKENNIILAFLLFFLSSCSMETEILYPGGGNDPNSRGYIEIKVTDKHESGDEGIDLTDDLKTIRFIVFSDLYTYPKVDTTYYEKITEPKRASALKVVLGVSRTDKLVVAIANEPDVKEVKTALDNIKTLKELENLELLMSHFMNDSHLSFKADAMMPMSGAVWVKKDDVQSTIDDAKAKRVGIVLERVLARVDVYLTTDIPGNVELLSDSKITLKNTYAQSYFVHHVDTTDLHDCRELGHIQTVAPPAKFVKKDWEVPVQPGSAPSISDKSDPVHVCSFYTPERSSITDKLVLDFALKTADGEKTASIVLKEATHPEYGKQKIDTIRRNNRYIVKGIIRKANIVSGKIEILKWNEGLEAFPLEQYFLTVDKSQVTYPAIGGKQTVTVATNYPGGWKIDQTTDLPSAEVEVKKANDNTVEITVTPRPVNTPGLAGSFTVKAGNLSKTINVTQWSQPVLEHHGNTFPLGEGTIPREGGKYTVEARTNLQDWRLQAYIGVDNNGILIMDQIGTTETVSPVTIDVYPTQINFPENPGHTTRRLSFYLYSPSTNISVRVGTWRQDPLLPAIPLGRLAPPGVLGVTTSGELTLRGSKEFGQTSIEWESEFGKKVHEETVFVVYFQLGSLVAITSLRDNDHPFSAEDVVWVPSVYGRDKITAVLGSQTGKAAWMKVPLNVGPGWPSDPQNGKGDPCPYATKDASGTLASDYRVPGGQASWNNTKSSYWAYVDFNLRAIGEVTKGYLDITRIDPNTHHPTWDMFLPIAGFRSGNNGSVNDSGVYYASGYGDSAGMDYYMYMDPTTKNVSYSVYNNYNIFQLGTPVRCVKK